MVFKFLVILPGRLAYNFQIFQPIGQTANPIKTKLTNRRSENICHFQDNKKTQFHVRTSYPYSTVHVKNIEKYKAKLLKFLKFSDN
jgi:hypothetical protein